MKALDIALKDLSHSFRSAFALAFMFGVPILITGIFYLAFGGLGGDGGFTMPATHVAVANLDAGSASFDPAALPSATIPEGVEPEAFDSLGAFVVSSLQADTLASWIEVTEFFDPAAARAAVDRQEAAVALVIPANFSEAVTTGEGDARIDFYQDPTLTLGPQVVKTIVAQFLDSFSSIRIALEVTPEENFGYVFDGYIAWLTDQVGDFDGAVVVKAPPEEPGAGDESPFTLMLGMIMVGMMVFYAFFTGTSSAQSILDEDEKGTLPRIFTTPTSASAVFAGKFLAAALTVLIQVVVLVLFGRYVFGIPWGRTSSVSLAIAGLVVSATTFGIFLISLMRDTRQAGVIYGAAITVTGMLGMLPIFTSTAPNAPGTIDALSLLVPQGWSIRAWRLAMEGATAADLWLPAVVLLLWSLFFFIVGRWRLQRRFA